MNWKGGKISKHCKACGSPFRVFPYRATTAQFCSISCTHTGNTYNAGRIQTKQTKKKISQTLSGRYTGEQNSNYGEKSPQWRGDKVRYPGLHNWVRKRLGTRPAQCEFCGTRGVEYGKRKQWSIHWANKSRKYKRSLDDWLRLCVKCHRAYDAA